MLQSGTSNYLLLDAIDHIDEHIFQNSNQPELPLFLQDLFLNISKLQ